MEWSRITSDEESDEPKELPLNRLQLMANSKGCSETIKNLQKAVQIHENRQSVLEEMRERGDEKQARDQLNQASHPIGTQTIVPNH